MNNSEPSTSHKVIFWCLFACVILITCAGFLGFLGWWGNTSDEKWAALGCGVFGIAAIFVLWKDKDTLLQARLAGNTAEEGKTQSVQEQRHRWETAISLSIVIATVGSMLICLIDLLVTIFLSNQSSGVYFYVGYIWLGLIWHVAHARRELAKLPS